MENQAGAPSDGVAAAPFSELISAWLDEGDRLDEKAIATAASAPAPVETRTRRILTLLKPAFDRHRVVVLAAAGLIPFALFTLTHRSASVVPVAAATVAARVATLPAPPAPAPQIAGICEAGEATPVLVDVRSPDLRPAFRPHHHHHHAAKLPATSRPVAPSAPAGPVAVSRPAVPSAHPVPAAAVRPAPSRAHAGPPGPPRRAPLLAKGQPLRH